VQAKIALQNRAEASRLRVAQEHTKTIDIAAECELTAIAAGGARIPLGRQRAANETSIVWSDGTSPVQVSFALLALGLVALLYFREIRPRMEPASLRGRLVVYDGPGDFRRITVPLKGRARFRLEGAEATAESAARVDADRLVLPGSGGTSAELYAEKSGKRSVMRLRKVRGDALKIGESPLGSEPISLKRGNARFSIGDYHCRIE
jgi:hypothetical protein